MRHVRILGPVTAHNANDPIGVRGVGGRTVLAALALAQGHAVSVDDLTDALWGDAPPARATASLRSTVSRLRAGFGPEAIVSEGAGYRLAPDAVVVDAAVAERALDDGDVQALTAALDLWQGEPLRDVAETVYFEAHRVRLAELRASLRHALGVALYAAGDLPAARRVFEAARHDDPLREPTQMMLMRVLDASGLRTEAIRAGHRYRDDLADSTGLLPTADFAALEAELLDDALRSASPPNPVKASSAATWAPPDNAFVGREADVEHAADALASSRLVSLVGPGGVGKTRLAMEFLAGLDSRAVVVVELAQLDEVTDLPLAVAGQLGLETFDEDCIPAIAERLDLADSVLVLDNAEHVLPSVRSFVEGILRSTTHTSVIVTSRRRIGLADEKIVRLQALAESGLSDSALDAVLELFDDRYRRATGEAMGLTDTESASVICAAVDGLPLAIELAAARAAVLGVDAVRDRLESGPEVLDAGAAGDEGRQSTIESLVEWSIALLEPDVAKAASALAVFPGPFDLEAAEAVLGVEGSMAAVVELAESSLLTVDRTGGTANYRMLVPVRSIARARGANDGSIESASEAHAAWVLALGDELEAAYLRDDTGRVQRLCVSRRNDIRVAIGHLVGHGHQSKVDRFARQLALLLVERADPDLAALMLNSLGDGLDAKVATAALCSTAGEAPRSRAAARAALAELDEDDDQWPAAKHFGAIAGLLIGELDAALGELEEIVKRPQLPIRWRGAAAASLILSLHYAGDNTAAHERWREHEAMLSTCEIGGFVSYIRAEIEVDSAERALQLLDRASGQARKHGSTSFLRFTEVARFSSLAGFGRWDEALELAADLVPALLSAGLIPHAWITVRTLADVLESTGRVADGLRLRAAAAADPRAAVRWEPTLQADAEAWDRGEQELGASAVEEIRRTGAQMSLGDVLRLVVAS